ncbi:MAG: PDZ domain-containing protein [Acidobacteriota bacterium]
MILALLILPASLASADALESDGDRHQAHEGQEHSAQEHSEGSYRYAYKVRVGDEGEGGPGDVHKHIHRVFHSVNRGFLGIEPVSLTPELRAHFGVAEDRGVLVGKVVEDSPAAAAGLEVGDILLAVNGEAVSGDSGVRRALRGQEAGDTVRLEVFRDSAYLELDATLTEAPAPSWGGMPQIHAFTTDDADFTFIGPDGVEIDLPNMEAFGVRMESLGEIGEELGEYFSSEEWAETMRQLEDIEPQVEIQMEVLEERLKELEKQLQKLEEGGE